MTKTAATDKVTATPTPDSAPTSVAEAKANVDKLAQAELERYRRVATTRRALFEAQQAQEFQKAAALREELEYLEDTESGRRERRAATVHLHSLQAEELEANAAALDAEIADRKAQSQMLFGKLEDLEGHIELMARYRSDRTKTQQLSIDAADMKQKAQAIRHQLKSNAVPDFGRASGMTADELVEVVMQLPENIGPTIASIHEWVEKRKGLGKYGQRMTMVWYRSLITELEWDGIILDDRPRKPGDPGTVADIKRKVAAKVAAR